MSEAKTHSSSKKFQKTRKFNSKFPKNPKETPEPTQTTDETDQHKKELQDLRQSQAEFFKFLEAEEPSLLAFGEEEQELLEEEKEGKLEEEIGNVLNGELFLKWKSEAPNSISATRKIVKAFHVAAFLSGTQETDEQFSFKYKILNSEIFNDIIMFSLVSMVPIFDSLVKKDTSNKPEELPEGESKHQIPNRFPKKWEKVKNIVRVYLKSVVKLLNTIVDTKMISFILKAIEKMVPYFGPFQKYTKMLLKKLLDLWGSSEETVRILAFFNLRELALGLPYPVINDVLKGSYITYVKNCRFYDMKTSTMVNFMANCVVELYGIDFVSSYQHGFVYLRQLAIHLRMAHITKSRASHDSTYNWQTMLSIKIWVKILCTYPNEEELWLLSLPLVQILHGMIALIPTQRFYPLRIHCVRMLNDLALARSNSLKPFFVNSASYLLEILTYPQFSKKPIPYSGKKENWDFLLKSAEGFIGTKGYLDNCLAEIHENLVHFFGAYSRSVAFPELIIPTVVQIRQFVKTAMPSSYVTKLKNLIEILQNNAKFITAQRNLVSFSPAQIKEVESFPNQFRGKTPLETYRENLIRTIQKEKELQREEAKRHDEEALEGQEDESEGDEGGYEGGEGDYSWEGEEGEEGEEEGGEGEEGEEEGEGEGEAEEEEEAENDEMEEAENDDAQDEVKQFRLNEFV